MNIDTMPSKMSKRLRDYLHGRQAEMTDLLTKLVLAESPSMVAESQQQVMTLLQQELEQRNYRVRRIPGRKTGGQLFAVPGDRQKNRPIQMLLGHCDTVWPLGTLKKMPVRQRQGKMYGPGIYDMKAGLVQAVFALEALLANEIQPEVAPVIFINSDEEIGSNESKAQIQRLAKVADRVFVMEPSLGSIGKLKTRRKGLGEFTIRIVGKAAHAGLEPEKGASAILELSFAIQQLFALNDSERGVTVNVGNIDGGIRPNVVAPSSKAVVDVRILHREDADRIEAKIRSLQPSTPGTKIIVEGGFDRLPLEKTPGNQRLWERAQQVASELDIEIDEATAGGGSDGNFTSLYTPTLDGMGAVGDAAHAPGEFVYLDRMVERSALLSRLLLESGIRNYS